MRNEILFTILAIVLIAGCTANQLAPGQLAKSSEEVKEFLQMYPNAKIVVVFIGKNDVNINELRSDCGNQMKVQDYWKATITDPDTNTILVLWLDYNTQKTLCAIRTGGVIQNQTETNLTGSNMGFGQVQVLNPWSVNAADGTTTLYLENRVGGPIKITQLTIDVNDGGGPRNCNVNPDVNIQSGARATISCTPSTWSTTHSAGDSYTAKVVISYTFGGNIFTTAGTISGTYS